MKGWTWYRPIFGKMTHRIYIDEMDRWVGLGRVVGLTVVDYIVPYYCTLLHYAVLSHDCRNMDGIELS